MSPLKIADNPVFLKEAHELQAIGLQTALSQASPGDWPTLYVAFLGMLIRHPDVPQRRRSDGWLDYGQHIYDALVSAGVKRMDIVNAASAACQRALESIPDDEPDSGVSEADIAVAEDFSAAGSEKRE